MGTSIIILSLIVLGIPFLGTTLGSAFVFFMKEEIPARVQKALLGFASGVMIAASVWSLLIPAIEMGPESPQRVVPAIIGFLLGMGFLLVVDSVVPHIHPADNQAEGRKSGLSRTTKLALAVTIHNLPEGMSVGIVLAAMLSGINEISPAALLTGPLALAIGIAVQNIPEGAIVSMPLRTAGNSKFRSFWIGTLSGIVEPIGAFLVVILASFITPAMPCLLAFAAGAMIYVVIEELIPEASSGPHSNVSTIGFAVGFVLMMALDVLLG